MNDSDVGKLIFDLMETIDELAKVPREQLMADANVISGSALALMLLAAELCNAEVRVEELPTMTVN